jgi:hypothetical protein
MDAAAPQNNNNRQTSPQNTTATTIVKSGDPLSRGNPAAKPPVVVKRDSSAYQRGSTPEHKEAGGSLFRESEAETTEKKEFETPTEVKEWVEKVEGAEEVTLPGPIKDEYGQILLETASPPLPKIVLPLTQTKTQQALHVKITQSIRWLALWCIRMLKMFPNRTTYGSSS